MPTSISRSTPNPAQAQHHERRAEADKPKNEPTSSSRRPLSTSSTDRVESTSPSGRLIELAPNRIPLPALSPAAHDLSRELAVRLSSARLGGARGGTDIRRGNDDVRGGSGTPAPVETPTATAIAPVTGPDGRTRIDTVEQLAQRMEDGLPLTNLDVGPLDLSPLTSKSGDETYAQFATRMQEATAAGTITLTPDERATVDAIAAHPELPWNTLFEGQDVSGTVFHGDLDYVNFDRARGTDVRFEGKITDGWMQSVDMPGVVMSGGVEGTNFTGANIPGAVISGEVERVAFNVAHLEGADLSGVRSLAHDDFSFATLDGAQLPAGLATMSEGTTFNGASIEGTTPRPTQDALIPPLVFDDALLADLGGPDGVRALQANNELFDALVERGYGPALDSALPASWRSFLAEGLGDGQPIKGTVHDAADGRYGGYDYRASGAPTLTSIYQTEVGGVRPAQELIEYGLAELVIRGGRLDDPTGLAGSAQGLDLDQWTAAMARPDVGWATEALVPDPAGPAGAMMADPDTTAFVQQQRARDSFDVPRPTLDALYAQMSRDPALATELETLRSWDNGNAFSIAELIADGRFPNALRLLHGIYAE